MRENTNNRKRKTVTSSEFDNTNTEAEVSQISDKFFWKTELRTCKPCPLVFDYNYSWFSTRDYPAIIPATIWETPCTSIFLPAEVTRNFEFRMRSINFLLRPPESKLWFVAMIRKLLEMNINWLINLTRLSDDRACKRVEAILFSFLGVRRKERSFRCNDRWLGV